MWGLILISLKKIEFQYFHSIILTLGKQPCLIVLLRFSNLC